ncbi:hypothetical protein E2C01_027955 [Portunus trituberculatus]|uniref:Uncharacterized protein n=1 Tax=Portunus trituberculatus TaxID=210409 RepID=A0A5B7EK29_PORTR|nr:hypothetical protein [Portunus trituberculatus]
MASKCPLTSSQENYSKKSRKTVTVEKKLEVLDYYAWGEKNHGDSESCFCIVVIYYNYLSMEVFVSSELVVPTCIKGRSYIRR